MTVAVLATTGIAARTRPVIITQKVAQPRACTRGVPRERKAMKGTKPPMKNVVHTSTFSTPCRLTLW
jgi:hypothetical protein